MNRTATIRRETAETRVSVVLNLDGRGGSSVSTGVGFYDHMLTALAKHAMFDLDIDAKGDIDIDGHHVIEDVAIALGQALNEALGDRVGVARFGDATVPLDEALARAAVDLSGRGGAWCSGEPDGMLWARIGGTGVPYAGSMTAHAVTSLAQNARATVHLTLLAGRDPHHIVEAQFKALARALRLAVALDPLVAGIPSTKAAL